MPRGTDINANRSSGEIMDYIDPQSMTAAYTTESRSDLKRLTAEVSHLRDEVCKLKTVVSIVMQVLSGHLGLTVHPNEEGD